jgi:TonB family protein
MKFCPTCQTRYDEEILRFCTKDGTLLVNEETPHFTELPSESVEDDFGEKTVVRRKTSTAVPPPVETQIEPDSAARIVIPTTREEPQQQVQTKTTTSYQRESLPRKSNTGKIVLLTILGTIALLAGAGGIFWFLGNRDSNQTNKNINVNANFNSIDTNLNTNLNIDNSFANFNVNANSETNLNTNVKTNINAKTPTPTPTPTPKPTASPTPPPNANVNANNSNLATPTPKPSATITQTPPPTATPKPSPSVSPTNRPVNAGVLNGRAVSLPKPAYPPIARQVRASGQVAVQVLVDEGGNVLSAKAMSGHQMLRAPAEAAARQSRFNPIKVGDRNVQATGIVLYNFINQ